MWSIDFDSPNLSGTTRPRSLSVILVYGNDRDGVGWPEPGSILKAAVMVA